MPFVAALLYLALAALPVPAFAVGPLVAPNFMIKAVAEDRGIAMPSFFGYILISSAAMLPLLAIIGVVFL